MSDNYILKVQILEGKGFGDDVQALLCSAGFAGETKQTQFSVNSNTHIWNSTLTWGIRKEELRKAQAIGSSHCKISVLGKDGNQLGWVVISLRSAKLQSQYKAHSKGLWLQLNASKVADPPQLKVAYSLVEERLLSMSEQPSSSDMASGRSLRRSSSSYQAAGSLRPSKVSSHRPSAADGEAASSIPALHGEALQLEGLELLSGDEGAAERQQKDQHEQQHQQDLSKQQAPVAQAAADGESPAISANQHESVHDKQPEQDSTGQQDCIHMVADTVHAPLDWMAASAVAPPQPEAWAAKAAAFDELAAAEANLPSYAQRRQQLLQQQQQEVVGSSVAGSVTVRSHAVDASEQSMTTAAAAAATATAKQAVAADAFSGHSTEQQQDPASHPIASKFKNESATPAAELQCPAADSSNVDEIAGDAGKAFAGPAVVQSQQPPLLDLSQSSQPAASSNAVHTVEHAVQDLGDPTRKFQLTLDVRSFQAGRRLPLALASTYVQAFLPQDLLGFLSTKCAAKLPPRLTPLRTLPAVDITRGSEGALPNGCVTVSFAAGVVSLAGLLAQEPKLTLEVWHKEKLRADLLLGVASVSLSALLQECWVDGYAPVYALMTKASAGSEPPISQQEEKVQVGLLRVIMSLEDQGPAGIPVAVIASPSKAQQQQQQQQRRQQQQQPHVASTSQMESVTGISSPVQPSHYGRHLQPQAGGAQAAPGADAMRQGQQQQAIGPQQHHIAQPPPQATGDDVGVIAAAGAAVSHLQQLPEYFVTWELENWKKAEEVKFRAQLRELEQQRMAVLEAQWWKREQAREAELAAMKAEFVKLQQQTQAVLTAAQAREASVLSAEADLRRRQSDLERQQAARMTEAEAAVRRLQVECEHQLSVERDRTAAVARQRDDAEVRLLAAEARAAGLEAQFTEYRAAQRNTSEAQLQAALDRASQAARLAQEKAAKALKAKRQYKQQVLQLARELAAHHEQRQAELLQELNRQQATALAQEQGRLASAAAAELSALRQQLHELKTVALQHGLPGAAAGSSRHANAARGKENRHSRRQHQYGWNAKDAQEPEPQWQQQQQHWPQHHHHLHNQHSSSSSELDEEGLQPFSSRPTHRDPEGDQAEGRHVSSDSGSSTEDEEPPKNRQRYTQEGRPAGSQPQSQPAVGGPQDFATAAAGADAALAEVAALAAILNKPRQQRSSGSAAPDHQQGLQQQEPVLAAAAVADPAVAAPCPPASRELTADGSWGNVGAAASSSAAGGPPSPASGNPLSQVRRLLKEKVELLASGLYSRDDAVILQIDARVQHLAEQQLQQ